MPYTPKELTDIVEAAVERKLAPITEQLGALDEEIKTLIRNRFAGIRVILKERFEATDADLDEILGHLEP